MPDHDNHSHHAHDHGGHGHHHMSPDAGDRAVAAAVGVNVLLTVAEIGAHRGCGP